METSFNPFRLPLKSKLLSRGLERLLGLSPLAKRYDERPEQAKGPDNYRAFLDYTMQALGVGIDLAHEDDLSKIPDSGPVLFVANHPFGGLEGVAMTRVLLARRPDLKVLTNELLTKIPELSSIFIGVDVLSGKGAAGNAKGLRQACKHLGQGGALLVYPAGQVSAINRAARRIEDRAWNKLVGMMARKYKAACVPFFVAGRNSRLFYLAALVHPILRTLMLPRELANKVGKRFTLHTGEIVSSTDVETFDSDQALTDYLRLSSDLLGAPANQHMTHDTIPTQGLLPPAGGHDVPLAIAQLERFKLLQEGDFAVYCAPYHKLGPVMSAIAYSRELTFRAAGEGTGKPLDQDQFDPDYEHLFLWDTKHSRLAGGYRIGRTDDIVRKRGLKGLYSHSHYHFSEQTIQRLGKALEMGRSFITPEYQRLPRSLDLLWKGIGAYVAMNPQYSTLFGCVSISSEHSTLARAFLSDSLLASFRTEQEYLLDVKPRIPLKVKGKVWRPDTLKTLSSIAVINKLLGQCDPGKRVPILLRQYLALNGRFVCFSVNTGFNDALDGLIIVDLRKTPSKYLKRYLGKDGCKQFMGRWAESESAA